MIFIGSGTEIETLTLSVSCAVAGTVTEVISYVLSCGPTVTAPLVALSSPRILRIMASTSPLVPSVMLTRPTRLRKPSARVKEMESTLQVTDCYLRNRSRVEVES